MSYNTLEDLKNKKGYCAIILISCCIIGLILVGVTAIITVVLVSDQTGNKRYCPQFVPGSINLNEQGRTISWYFQTTGTSSIQIHGPTQPGMTTGPLFLPLCGYPSTFVCSLSTPGILQGSIGQTSGGNSLKPFITPINDQPSLYYVTIDNVTVGTLGIGC